MGMAHERATIESEEPLRAEGLIEAIRDALREGGVTYRRRAVSDYGHKWGALQIQGNGSCHDPVCEKAEAKAVRSVASY